MKTSIGAVISFCLLLMLSGRSGAFATTTPQRVADSTRTVSLDDVNKIARLLMAPCCWSETADVHNSSAAQEVRTQIRSALQGGYSEAQILDSMVAAYGERILARPKARGFNLLAWIMPGVALVIGAVLAWRFLAHSRMKKAPQPLKKVQIDESYEQRIERELQSLDD